MPISQPPEPPYLKVVHSVVRVFLSEHEEIIKFLLKYLKIEHFRNKLDFFDFLKTLMN